MNITITIINTAFAVILYPFRSLAPVWGLLFLSVLTAVLMLVIFKITSNQKKIKMLKERIKASFMELVLYKDFSATTINSFAKIIKLNSRYIGSALIPLVCMLIPILIIMVQLNARYGLQPFERNQTTTVKVHLRKRNLLWQCRIQEDPFFSLVTPPVRIPAKKEIIFKIKVLSEGTHSLKLSVKNTVMEKQIVVENAGSLIPVNETRPYYSRIGYVLLNHLELPARNPAFQDISITYPARSAAYWGLPINWAVLFFLLSIIAGMLLKDSFGVEI